MMYVIKFEHSQGPTHLTVQLSSVLYTKPIRFKKLTLTCNDDVVHFEDPESWCVHVGCVCDVDDFRCEGVGDAVVVHPIPSIHTNLSTMASPLNQVVSIQEEQEGILSIRGQCTLEGVSDLCTEKLQAHALFCCTNALARSQPDHLNLAILLHSLTNQSLFPCPMQSIVLEQP